MRVAPGESGQEVQHPKYNSRKRMGCRAYPRRS